AEELVHGAAEAVGSALGDDAEDAAGVAAELGRVARRHHLELLNAFERHADDRAGVAALGVVHAVDEEADVVGAGAVDGVLAVAAIALGDDAAGEEREVGEVAAVEGHLRDLFVGGDFAAGG